MSNHDYRILVLEVAVLDLQQNLSTIVRTIDHIGSVIESIDRKHNLEHQIDAMRRSLKGEKADA
jgi:hypothetical protein